MGSIEKIRTDFLVALREFISEIRTLLPISPAALCTFAAERYSTFVWH
jgi:hypothetical protein